MNDEFVTQYTAFELLKVVEEMAYGKAPRPMSRENWQLVTNKPVEFAK